jgi:hypothetical protein
VSIFCATIINLYSFPFRKDPKEITGPAVGSTKSILKSIKAFGPAVKRVIITSSFASIVDSEKRFRPGYSYAEKDWNPVISQISQISIRLTLP